MTDERIEKILYEIDNAPIDIKNLEKQQLKYNIISWLLEEKIKNNLTKQYECIHGEK